MIWPDGTTTGSWTDPTAFVLTCVLIAATYVAAVCVVAVVAHRVTRPRDE